MHHVYRWHLFKYTDITKYGLKISEQCSMFCFCLLFFSCQWKIMKIPNRTGFNFSQIHHFLIETAAERSLRETWWQIILPKKTFKNLNKIIINIAYAKKKLTSSTLGMRWIGVRAPWRKITCTCFNLRSDFFTFVATFSGLMSSSS